MSGVTQPTNNYVCNLSISLGEIPNMSQYCRSSFNRIRGANANNIGKLMDLIGVFVGFAHIMFYIWKTATIMILTITYADFTESSPECTWSSMVNDHLSDLGLCSIVRSVWRCILKRRRIIYQHHWNAHIFFVGMREKHGNKHVLGSSVIDKTKTTPLLHPMSKHHILNGWASSK
jgi:hypothetical protein